MTNYIFYVIRAGYEIRVFLKDIPSDITEERIEFLAREECKHVGVELLPGDIFEWEEY